MAAHEKQLLRTLARERIRAMGAAGRAAASAEVRRLLREWPVFVSARCVAGFAPMADEPDWIGEGLAGGRVWLLPRARADGSLAWVETAGLEALAPGAHGVREPRGEEVPHPRPEIVLVPGRAFDFFGGRVGRGRGFYDRALAVLPGLRVGVGFRCQVFDTVPMADGDAAMDAVLTEAGLSFGDRRHRPGGGGR